uniref:Uncharacterized protein n=1 Tax=Sphaerodactylus townsendi TaxID=933632 RepID=A0ACB8FTJ4_9SAUR
MPASPGCAGGPGNNGSGGSSSSPKSVRLNHRCKNCGLPTQSLPCNLWGVAGPGLELPCFFLLPKNSVLLRVGHLNALARLALVAFLLSTPQSIFFWPRMTAAKYPALGWPQECAAVLLWHFAGGEEAWGVPPLGITLQLQPGLTLLEKKEWNLLFSSRMRMGRISGTKPRTTTATLLPNPPAIKLPHIQFYRQHERGDWVGLSSPIVWGTEGDRRQGSAEAWQEGREPRETISDV